MAEQKPSPVEAQMRFVYSVGQFVRFRRMAGVYEIIRILPVMEEGGALYLIRSTQGIETIARHHEIQKA
jgi:hypothetical protein